MLGWLLSGMSFTYFEMRTLPREGLAPASTASHVKKR